MKTTDKIKECAEEIESMCIPTRGNITDIESILLAHWPKEEWVSVEKRLPEEQQLVIACTKDGRMMQLTGFLLDTATGTHTPKHMQFPATHWRVLHPPLPPPPKMEGE